jgi:RimJ/RimL family protein N-acetyltransferase
MVFLWVHGKLSNKGQERLAFKCLPVLIEDNSGRPIQIRTYEAADFKALHDMYETFEPKGLECGLPPPNDQVRLRWVNYLVSELFNVLALHKGRVIGHIALDLSRSPLCPEYLIFVRKGFRNLGIGTALSAVMKKVAEEAGCEKVVVTVRTANRRAIKVFERVGFGFCSGIEACRDMELLLKRAGTCRGKLR